MKVFTHLNDIITPCLYVLSLPENLLPGQGSHQKGSDSHQRKRDREGRERRHLPQDLGSDQLSLREASAVELFRGWDTLRDM